MTDLLKIAGRLPPKAQHELLDFAEFLERKYASRAETETAEWSAIAEASLAPVWDNPDDDVYDELR